MTPGTIRILVADDQELVRRGIETILQGQPDFEVVAGAANGAAAVELTGRLQPDVVLMDIRMPGTDGLEATRRLMSGPSPHPKVVVLTTFDADEYVLAALQAGASGFLLKDVSRRSLAEAVRQVHEGGTLLAPAITLRLVERHLGAADVDPQRRQVLSRLTVREQEVLTEICAGASNTEIAQRPHVSEGTVKTHVGQLLAKTGSRDRVQLVIFGFRTGVTAP
jgi:DNA-binding NarL/FixJ family response regulator